jgi:hypothetical protein
MKAQRRKEIPAEYLPFEAVAEMPILDLNINDNYNNMGEKAFVTMKLSYEKFPEHKWFLMADDDTYIFTENLEKFMKEKSSNEPYLYGFKFNVIVPNGYLAGGPGILFTHESMKRLTKEIGEDRCVKDMYSDISIGNCANRVNVSIGNSDDSSGKPRFHPANPTIHYYGPLPGALFSSTSHNGKLGKECCSVESIGFHWVAPDIMPQIYANKTFLQDMLS